MRQEEGAQLAPPGTGGAMRPNTPSSEGRAAPRVAAPQAKSAGRLPHRSWVLSAREAVRNYRCRRRYRSIRKSVPPTRSTTPLVVVLGSSSGAADCAPATPPSTSESVTQVPANRSKLRRCCLMNRIPLKSPACGKQLFYYQDHIPSQRHGGTGRQFVYPLPRHQNIPSPLGLFCKITPH